MTIPTWTQIKAAWSSGWTALQSEAMKLYEASIRADPTGYLAKVEAFVSELTQSRANIDRIKAKLPNPPVTAEDRGLHAKVRDFEKRYHDLAAGLYADAQPATSMGAAPLAVGVVVAGVVIGVAGIAWSVAAYEYAVNLREQTALADKELEARVEAGRQGRTLQPTTVPAQPDPVKKAQGIGWLLVGGLVVAAGAVAVPMFLKKKAG